MLKNLGLQLQKPIFFLYQLSKIGLIPLKVQILGRISVWARTIFYLIKKQKF